MSDWFSTGKEAEKQLKDEADRRKAAQEARGKEMVYRHWMPPEAEQQITIVDGQKHPAGYDLPFVYREHQLSRNGNWRNWYTCIDGVRGEDGKPQKCPLCEAGDKPYIAAAYTIIDHNEWKSSRDGSVHKDERKLMICKTNTQHTLARISVKRKGLRGVKFDVVRTSAQAASTGDQFDFDSKVELEDSIQPFDYHKILAPLSRDALTAILKGESSTSVPDGYDDDVADTGLIKY